MKKKMIVFLTVMSVTLSMLTGCGDSSQTEEVLVTPKEEAGGQVGNMVQEEQFPVSVAGEMLSSENESEEIWHQVQAPERFETDISQDGIHITADAKIIVPKASGFQLYQVEPRCFEQEDYDRVNHVLLQDAFLFREVDRQAMEELFKEHMVSLEAQKAALEEKAAAIEEEISLLPEGSEMEASLLVAEIKKYAEESKMLQMEMEYERLTSEENISAWVTVASSVSQNGELTGYAMVEGEKYYVNLNNKMNLLGSKQWSSFEVSRDGEPPGEYILLSNYDSAPEGFFPSDIEKAARELIEDIGLEDMELFGSEYVVYKNTEKTACCVHFTRVIQDVPVTYTNHLGDKTGSYGSSPWAYEGIDIFFDENGICDFNWYSPYQLAKQSEEYVFLLPFSDIQEIFGKMMIEQYKERTQTEQNVSININVHEVRLGYMRVREDGNDKIGTMIPVWDFFGSRNANYLSNNASETVFSGPYESLMTINAMDGTIIDRGLGY